MRIANRRIEDARLYPLNMSPTRTKRLYQHVKIIRQDAGVTQKDGMELQGLYAFSRHNRIVFYIVVLSRFRFSFFVMWKACCRCVNGWL